MTNEETLKLALEALETYHGYMEPLTTVFGGPRVPAEQSTTGKVETAITSLRQALEEALAKQEQDEKRKLLPRCFADYQPNHTHDRKCEWCAVNTECQTGEQPKQEPDYKALWKQMCERCDELDAKLAKQEHDPYDEVFIAYGLPKQEQGEPVGFITNKRQRLNVELKPNAIVWMPTATDWELPLFTTPQPDQNEVEIRSRLYQRIHELEDLLRDIAEYEGEGPSTTDYRAIVKSISLSARSALGEEI